jgi:hypothetical protein
MRGKVGIVIGLAAGYVLGSRAGRERYEQIKSGFLKVWNTDPVQKQVVKAKEMGTSAALALPTALWDGAVKAAKAAANKSTPGQKLDAVISSGKESADDVARAAEKTAAEAKKAADKLVDDVKKSADA